MDFCAFCDKTSLKQIKERSIIETANFRVFPTYGQIAEGYLLIAPKDHISCMGTLPIELFDEFVELKASTKHIIKSKYDRPIFMEHGLIGQTVSHAHVHAIPFPKGISLYNNLSSDFPYVTEYTHDSEVRTLFKMYGAYVTYEQDDKKFFFHTNIQPQYGRILAADILGVPKRANWRTMNRSLDERLIKNTINNLKQ